MLTANGCCNYISTGKSGPRRAACKRAPSSGCEGAHQKLGGCLRCLGWCVSAKMKGLSTDRVGGRQTGQGGAGKDIGSQVSEGRETDQKKRGVWVPLVAHGAACWPK